LNQQLRLRGTIVKQSNSGTPELPSVVQIGFSGSRELFPGVQVDSPDALALVAETETWLEQRLATINSEIRLEDNQFLVGISQVACGADMIFSRVCQKRSIPQRIFLPQHRDLFVSAVSKDGTPDFTPRQRAEAEAILASNHIVQEQVAANSPDRSTRFEDTNYEIMRISDAIICLLRADDNGKRGGTYQFLARAKRRGIPVLEIRVAASNGRLNVERDEWHNITGSSCSRPRNLPDEFRKLHFPPLASGVHPIPRRDEYCEALGKLTWRQASQKQTWFKLAAAITILTHLAATVLATLALAAHDYLGLAVSMSILVVEFLLLAGGFSVHYAIHHSRMVQVWAISRMVNELLRSLRAIGSRHIYLEHFFRLQLPHRYRPLLRTLSILHLHSTRPLRDLPWQAQRDNYIRERFDDAENGQVPFFERALLKDQRLLAICQWIFIVCSLLAMAATACELVLSSGPDHGGIWRAIIGGLAISLPVLAVGGLSWAAAVDSEARVQTFEEGLQFLRRQRPYLEQAESGSEFDQLLLETETALLGEISSWYSRRSSKGVT
jgi:hypothetical protein